MSLVTPPNSGSRSLVAVTGHLARAAYKRLGELQFVEEQSRPKKRKGSSKNKKMGRVYPARTGSGFFKGGFNGLKTVSPTFQDMVLTKGSAGTIETYGSCLGTEIVWVGATTCNIAEMAYHASKAILRKLFKQAGLHITDAQSKFTHELYWPANTSHSGGFMLRLQYADGPGNLNDVTYTLVDPETLNTLANNCNLKQAIIDYANASSDKILLSIRLYNIDYQGGTSGTSKQVAILNMRNEMIHMYSSVKIVVQNRTKGAGVAGENLNFVDTIDAQPLKGKLYYFKKGNPEIRGLDVTSGQPNSTSLFSRWGDNTVKLISDTSIGYNSQMVNPPSPQYWNNCSKHSNISLEPGDLKDCFLSNTTEKYFSEFVRSLAWYNGAGNRRQKVGDCLYICLEERLNSGSANPIVVQYEAESNISCYLTTNKVDPIIKTFAATVVNH